MAGRSKLIFLLTFVVVMLLASVFPALAHDGDAHGNPWSQWSWQELPLLVLTGALYGAGVRSAWKRAGTGGGISRGQVAAFGAGLSVLFVALVSPLDALSEQLFSIHMVQHLLLIVVAAPLFVIGRFSLAVAWAFPARWTSRAWKTWSLKPVWKTLTRPAVASLIHAAAIWTWHMPQLYQASLRNEGIHFLQHFTFFLAALLFWQVFRDLTANVRAGRSPKFGLGVFSIFGIAMANGLLGVLIAFSPYIWYPLYQHETALFGLTALEDQQLGGTIMWVPAGIVYTAAALSVVGRWLFAMESLENPQS